MDPAQLVFLAAAAFAAGAVNAVAGGGSLISFPALVAAGYPAKTANVTNTVALWPGYLSGTLAYRRELDGQRKRATAMLIPSMTGALGGSIILLWTPEATFSAIVPYLILFACALMAFQRPLSNFTTSHRLGARDAEHVPASLYIGVFFMSIYGAYFGAGLGIMLLAVLAVLLPDDLHRCNALKGLLSFVINAVAVAYFAFFGPVQWLPAVVMAVGAVGGGYLGVGAVRRVPAGWLRTGVVCYGVFVAAYMLWG
jgi:uncharacterized protein